MKQIKTLNNSAMNKPNGSGLIRIFKAAHCSLKGFKSAFIHESAFRQELFLTALLVPASFYLAQSNLHHLMLISTLFFVLFAEIINSALEALADKITTEHDELIGRAKDLGSSAVFLAISLLVLIWAEALYTKFLG
ncbi:diacylglycerol kinase [Thalassomonas viridans]|uniref:Diacylglycerol kinase n=1 Tax=Thalassomonas viridans TaxID=137584 RepID=A0AAE9Z665_9GAMM|nr:diacylglycerol kinase [Thalassomonas viridans]WDE06819.1 diacylglycerol kinase [Thalassomonas viridans]